MIKSKKQMYIVIGAFALVLTLFTTTYAFFNYTRTGTGNIIKTGRIYFNSEQGTAINLTNIFPVDVSNGIPNDPTKIGAVTINVTGDTTYGEGIEYLVSAVNVENAVGSKQLPISINVSVESNTHGEAPNETTTTLGTLSNDYFEDRGSTTSYYKVLAPNTIEDNSELLVGYIAPGATGVDGNIVIKAYLDASKIAISDTYPEGDVTHTEGEEPNQTTVTDYTNGTTTEWVNDREVFTTTEWNSLQTNGVSFKVKVEANEGTWVDEPAVPLPDTIASCPGCVYTYTTEYLYYGNNGTVLQEGEYSTDYRTVITNERKNFYGVILDGTGMITRAFACGIKGNVPYCIEGTTNGSAYNDNKTLLQGASLWNGTCTPDYLNSVEYRISCGDPEEALTRNDGLVMTYTGDYYCRVDYDGAMDCGED